MFHGNKCIKIYVTILAVVLLLNFSAWSSAAFCDWYIAHVFPVWVNTYGRLTGLFPFSVGEWLIVEGLVLVIVALVFLLILLVATIRGLIRQKPVSAILLRAEKRFFSFFAWVLLFVCLIMTLNCTILYHASTFSQTYFGANTKGYSAEELIQVYNLVAGECNRLSEMVERDEQGRPVYDGDMAAEAKKMMQKLGETYPQLDGWYPNPKPMFFSDFMCQQHMQGYYFPFSMEANINTVMYQLNKPSSMCHELAHLRGYIYEDEANFISYLACVQSDDIFFQYAGYLSVLVYLNNDLVKVYRNNRDAYFEAAAKVMPCEVNEQVWADDIFVEEKEWERINKKALIDTDKVDEAANIFVDTNLKVNGVSDGRISYSRVVRLLLQYYEKINL